MAAIPAPTHATVARIYALHEAKRENETPRDYLGCSELGQPCARRLWLSFRHAGGERFDGRMLRLFDTGNREEARILDELRAIGVKVEGQQWEVETCDGHVKGHLDAAVLGLEEAPKTWHVVDVKTAKTDKYKAMVSKGVGAVYPTYAAQLQMYMGLTGMTRAAFFLVCKETDEIHMERVDFDKAEYARLLAKAQAIVDAAEPPPRISDDPAWFECKFCPFHAQCHGEDRPTVNCRTCAHSTAVAGGAWMCGWHGDTIPADVQRTGCDEHRYIPVLLERVAELEEADGNKLRWRNKLTGKTFDQPGYDSRELHDAQDFRVIGDDFVQEYKTVFGQGTRVVGPTPQQRAQMAMADEIKDDIPWEQA